MRCCLRQVLSDCEAGRLGAAQRGLRGVHMRQGLPVLARRASTRMNREMTERVLRAPLAFFHTNPSGRILNRSGLSG